MGKAKANEDTFAKSWGVDDIAWTDGSVDNIQRMQNSEILLQDRLRLENKVRRSGLTQLHPELSAVLIAKEVESEIGVELRSNLIR